MNRTTSRLLLLLFTSTILASCISTHATVNTQIPSVAVSLSPTQDSKNQYDQFLIWHHDNSSFGIPLSIRNGSSGDYWFLYEKALIHFHNNEYSETISFDMLEPSIGIANGSIAVREDNSVWVGFPLGVLVVQTKDHFSFIPSEEIFPSDQISHEAQVILVDRSDQVWVADTVGNLCFQELRAWNCDQFSQAIESQGISVSPESSHVLTGTNGTDSELWFGWLGAQELIHYSEGVFNFLDIEQAVPLENPLFRVDHLAYDDNNQILWIVDSTPPRCGEGTYSETTAVVSLGQHNRWKAYDKSLFMGSPGAANRCWGALTSVSVAESGRVWIGMRMQHGLVYFDRGTWFSKEGIALPYEGEKPWSGLSVSDDVLVDDDGNLLVMGIPGIYKFRESEFP
ncbi:MAG: hypothetical protein P8X64_16335 [Anaerolineales bacterium]|jgi:hypothetical protein